MADLNQTQPGQCTLCGYYFTVLKEYAGHRCLDPAHWQAAGLLAPNDFFPMAQLMIYVGAESNRRHDRRTGN
jgi:hypothetical protein